MKRTFIAVSSVACAVACLANDGFDRYQAMGRGRLVPLIGDHWSEWTPDGRGVKGHGVVSGIRVPAIVDPVDGTTVPLLSPKQVKSLVEQCQQWMESEPRLAAARQVTKDVIAFSDATAEYRFQISTHRLRRYRRAQHEQADPLGIVPAGSFSPDMRYYSHVRDGDLYVVNTNSGRERRLTTRSQENGTIGFLGSGSGYVWSPNGRHIVYLRSSTDGQYDYPIQQHLDVRETVETLSYPFVAAPLPRMRLVVVDAENGNETTVATNDNTYLRNPAWVAGGTSLLFQEWDRQYNRFELRLYSIESGTTATLHEEISDSFLNDGHQTIVLDDGNRFLLNSRRSGWNHLYRYDVTRGLVNQVSTGNLEVDRVLLSQGDWLYFAAFTNAGLDRHLFRVRLDGTKQQQLTEAAGYHQPTVDPTGRYFIDHHSSLEWPPRVDLHRTNGEHVRTVSNAKLDRVRDLRLLDPELVTVEASDGETALHGTLYKPAGFVETESYPLIEYLYGGAHSKECANAYATDNWLSRMSQLGFVVWVCDARGTPRRGAKFAAAAHRRLGRVDIDDHAHAVSQLAMRNTYIDAQRVGIHGISHGGLMTLHGMFKHADVYRVGVATAPLTLLEAGPMQYVEKSMGTLASNPDGYRQASPVNFVAGLTGKLLIQHGTNDRNSLLTNTMVLSRALVDADKDFDLMIYPGGVHVFTGNDSSHASKQMLSYFLKHLRPEGWEDSRQRLWPRQYPD